MATSTLQVGSLRFLGAFGFLGALRFLGLILGDLRFFVASLVKFFLVFLSLGVPSLRDFLMKNSEAVAASFSAPKKHCRVKRKA